MPVLHQQGATGPNDSGLHYLWKSITACWPHRGQCLLHVVLQAEILNVKCKLFRCLLDRVHTTIDLVKHKTYYKQATKLYLRNKRAVTNNISWRPNINVYTSIPVVENNARILRRRK